MIFLDKNEIYFKSSNKEKSKKVKSIFPYLNSKIELSDNVTLENIFEIIEREKELFNIIFSSNMGRLPIEDFINEIKSKDRYNDDSIDYLEVGYCIEIFDDKKNEDSINKNDNTFELHFSEEYFFIGRSYSSEESYNVSLIKLSTIKDLKVKIDDVMIMNIIRLHGNDELYRFKSNIKVYDFFRCILSEISFYGNMESKCKILEQVNEQIKEIKKDDTEMIESFEDIKYKE